MAPTQVPSSINIVSRLQWGARSPKSTSPLTKPVTYVFIHHTAGPTSSDLASGKQTVKGIQNYHMDSQKWDDIGYSFLIGGDGSIFEGRGWSAVGAHTAGYNTNGYGISFLGNFSTSEPTSAALSSAKNLIAFAVNKGYLKNDYIVKGHRQMGSTECPGTKLYNTIKTWSHYSA